MIVTQDNKLIQKMSTDHDYERNLTKQSFVLDVYQRKMVALLMAHVSPDVEEFRLYKFSHIIFGGIFVNKFFRAVRGSCYTETMLKTAGLIHQNGYEEIFKFSDCRHGTRNLIDSSAGKAKGPDRKVWTLVVNL